MARLPEFVYSIARDGIYVNLYSPSRITWSHGGSKVTLNTSSQFPGDTRVSLKIFVNDPVSLNIHVRIPSWSAGEVMLLVNGQKAATGAPGTYATLNRTWSSGDTISFDIPMGLRLTRYTGFDRDPHDERYGLEYGPLLMSLVGGTGLNFAPQSLIGSLLPVTGGPVQFSIAGHPALKYVPYVLIQDETFTSFPTLS